MNLLTCLKMTDETIDETIGNWEECVVDNDYEIWNQYPYPIKRKNSDRIIRESKDGTGYMACSLNKKTYKKHRIIALQWLPNDDPINKRFIDHKNRIRTDNRLENLRFVSSSENNMNRSASRGGVIEYVDSIPDEAIVVLDYNEHEFEDLYYYNDYFYFYNGVQYRKLHICYTKNGRAYVQVKDINGKKVCLYYSYFKRLYDLL